MESKKSQLSQSFRLHSLSSSSFWWCWSLRITQGTGSNAYSCVPPCLLGVFPGVAVTAYHKLGGLDHRSAFSHNAGGQKFKIKVAAGPGSLRRRI